MILIDKYELLKEVAKRKYSAASMRLINEQPEVKAIPIDWILHQAIETDEQGSFTTAYLMLTEKWRNENETNRR